MSVPSQALSLSIKRLEYDDIELKPNEVVCEILKNSENILSNTLDHLTNVPVQIPNLIADDIIQLILKNKHNQELIGCISFNFKTFIKQELPKISQWITLFEDPEDDQFDGKLGIDDEETPRVYVCFDILYTIPSSDKKEKAYLAPPQHPNSQNEQFESGQSHRDNIDEESDIANYKLHTENGSVEKLASPRFDTDYDENHEISSIKQTLIHSIEENDTIRTSLPDYVETLSFGRETERLVNDRIDPATQREANEDNHYKERNDSEESFSSASVASVGGEEGDNPVKILKKDFAKEIALLSDKLQQANDLAKSAKDLREMITKKNSLDLENRASMTKTSMQDNKAKEETKAVKEENENLNKRLQELTNKIDSLKKENEILRNSEIIYAENLCKVKVELEKNKLSKGGNDRLVNDLQERLDDAQDQIKEEIQSRLKLMKEKEKLSNSLHNLNEENQLLKRDYEELVRDHLMLKQTHATEREELMYENNKNQEKIRGLEIQEEEDKEIIHRLKENIGFLEKEKEAFELLAASPSELNKNGQGNEKILITALLNQIDDLKAHVQHLENEKYDLKDELFKANDNYAKLTNKYVELTEVVSGQRPTSRSMLNTSRSRTPKRENLTNTNTSYVNYEADSVDDIEYKLNEFVVANKISANQLIRQDRNTYLLNGKKTSLKVANGKLLARQGTSFVPFEDFWKNSLITKTQRAKTPSNVRSENHLSKAIQQKREEKTYRDFTPERKLNVSPAPQRESDQVSNDEQVFGYDWIQKKGIKESQREDINHLSVEATKKSIGEAKQFRSEGIKQKEVSQGKTIDKKLVDSVYRFKGRSHRDLSPVLKSHSQLKH